MSILHKLNWRYAAKDFDTDRQVPEEDITELLQAMNLAPSSYGLQPFEFIVIKNKELQSKLLEFSYGQEKVLQVSHVLVIAARTVVNPDYIKDYVVRTEHLRNLPKGTLQDFENSILGSFEKMSQQDQLAWSKRQAYIALGVLMVAAADLKIDSCPMEGFIPEKYNELLGLDKQNLHATLVIPLGYRAQADSYQSLAKSRRDLADIVTLKYDSEE